MALIRGHRSVVHGRLVIGPEETRWCDDGKDVAMMGRAL